MGQFLLEQIKDPPGVPCVIIGRDTRVHGNTLVLNLKAGLLSHPIRVVDVGIATTPSISYLTKQQHGSLGAIITASHNPPEYNGLKLVGSTGLRIQRTKDLEELINLLQVTSWEPSSVVMGWQDDRPQLLERYVEDQLTLCPFDSLEGLTVIVDCANGASSNLAPQVLRRLGAHAITINDDNLGCRINHGCGSEHVRQYPNYLVESVRNHHAAYGLAFDGDGDRLVIVDRDGNMYNGDDFLFVLAMYFHEQGRLRGETIVTTALSNTGLAEALNQHGIKTVHTQHGDRNLESRMWDKGYTLGSEYVGNVIINDGHHAAADPLYAALILMGLTRFRDAKLNELAAALRKYPQVLASVPLPNTPSLETTVPLQRQIENSRRSLGAGSRIQAWYSSTERKLFKIMIEGGRTSTLGEVRREAFTICETIQRIAVAPTQEPTILDLSSRCS